MFTDSNTGKSYISNNLEYEKYIDLEQKIDEVVELLEFEVSTPVKGKTIKHLQDLSAQMFQMREEYDKKRLNANFETTKKKR